jgi:hypothetical protein
MDGVGASMGGAHRARHFLPDGGGEGLMAEPWVDGGMDGGGGSVADRPSWMNAPPAVSASIFDDLRNRVRSLEGDAFPMSRKELLLFLDTARGPKGGL